MSDPNPNYKLDTLKTQADINEFTDMIWESWYHPYNPAMQLASPIFGYTAAAKEAAVEASKARMWKEFTTVPNRVWLVVRHRSEGYVGGVTMNFATGSAFPDGVPRLEFWWWPEGESVREFCELMMGQVHTLRSMWMQEPHGGMWNLVVHPKHRNRGLAHLLLTENNRLLDERGLEGFVEATELGRPAYEKAGYLCLMKCCSYLPAGCPEDWVRFFHEMGLQPWHAMWRPPYGRVGDGERRRSWQLRRSIPISSSDSV